MRLSEAMMLGAATVKMVAGDWNSCALGAACNAIGAVKHADWPFLMPFDVVTKEDGTLEWVIAAVKHEPTIDRRTFIVKTWPWLMKEIRFADAPEWCRRVLLMRDLVEYPNTVINMLSIITRGFDHGVVTEFLTLEQLVDWVRSVEPSCECARFGCGCVEAAVLVDEALAVGAPEEAARR